MYSLLSSLSQLDWEWWLIFSYRITFVLGLISLFVAKYYLPIFLQYGKTWQRHETKGSLWQNIMCFTVPKSFFQHFYILSTIMAIVSLYWHYQYFIIWIILFHSIRRLYETRYVSVYTTKSRMNWSHYAVGIWFYSSFHMIVNIKLYQLKVTSEPRLLPTIIFLMASIDQNSNHKILSRLVKYSLPKDGLFKYICCPHYMDEILIYLSFVTYCNELFWPFIWVIISLTIAAKEARQFYVKKFKEKDVPRYCILPYVI